jgi:hypothetical protein
MTLAIMQPYFFPYIGYFQLIGAVDKFVVYDDVNFIKRGWVNRNRILLNGSDHMVSIPVIGASQNRTIRETLLDPDTKSRKKLLKTITHSYKDAPYYDVVYPIIEGVILSSSVTIAEYALFSIQEVVRYLDILTEIVPSSTRYGNEDLKGADRILDICITEKAEMYINPSGGIELYDRLKFRAAGIDLRFIQPSAIPYKQGNNNEFVANLSIIDVLMHNSKEEVGKLIQSFQLT